MGLVWLDVDGNGVRELGEPGLYGVEVRVLWGGKVIGTVKTQGDGRYRAAGFPAGEYVVRELNPWWLRFSSTPDEVAVVLEEGGEATADFGDWSGRALYLPLIVWE